MLTKQYLKGKPQCKVTFELSADAGVTKGVLVGDFNDWDETATPLKRRKDGTLYATVTLDKGASYRFRYRSEDGAWINDPEADGYDANPFGSDDSIVAV